MRQNARECSFWYVLLFVGFALVIFHGITYNASYMKEITGCRAVGPLDFNQDDALLTDDDAVLVPLSEIMPGKPIILPQDDPRLVNYIWRNQLILSPSENAYNLQDPDVDPSSGQGQYIRQLLKNMTNGFFVECGGLDGETRSNTLFMEKNLNWTGLLVEADPINFDLLSKKNRKAWISNTCLSVKPHPHTATFSQGFSIGKIVSTEETGSPEKQNQVDVQCVPLFSLLTAINVTTVDYFSLDVEGAELQVLKTIPFEKVFIRTLSVEIKHTVEGETEVLDFMTSKGYRMDGKVVAEGNNKYARDFMFVHKDAKI